MTLTVEQRELLRELFMAGMFKQADEYDNPRMRKAESLYQLATVANGPILEIGTYQGCGAISLYWGSQAGTRQPVMTCDDYTSKKGWIGESYTTVDKDIFLKNLHRANAKVRLFQMDASTLLDKWKVRQPWIGLLFWDIGGERLFDDFVRWNAYILPGGVFAIHDTANKAFGFDRVRLLALATGSWECEELPMPGWVYILRRIL